MIFHRQPAIGALDVLCRRRAGDAEDLVIIALGGGQPSSFTASLTMRHGLASPLGASRRLHPLATFLNEEFCQSTGKRQRKYRLFFAACAAVKPPLYRTRRLARSLAIEQPFHR